MNVFILSIGVLYVGGAVVEFYRGDWRMAAVYLTWAMTNVFLGTK